MIKNSDLCATIPCDIENWEFRNIASANRVGTRSRTFEPRALEKIHRDEFVELCAVSVYHWRTSVRLTGLRTLYEQSVRVSINGRSILNSAIEYCKYGVAYFLALSIIWLIELVGALTESFQLKYIGVTAFEIFEIIAT